MDEDPLGMPRQLKKAVEAKAKELGLEVTNFLVRIGSNKNKLQIVFKVTPDAVKTVEDKQFDDQFEAMMSGFTPELEEEEDPEKFLTEPTTLEKWLEDGD